MPVSERAVEQKILIAVDFGTTFSSVVWASTGEVDGQHVIQDWPDETSTSQNFHGFTTDTVPTTLLYDNNGCRWGYQIKAQEKRYEWFKLGLAPSMEREKYSLVRQYPGTTQLPMQLSSSDATSPEKLTTAYLRAVHSHVERLLRRNVVEAILRTTQREYVITVPAVWKETARDLTAKCAVNAGMGFLDKLHIVSEPEAAAMYAITKFKEMNRGELKVGDTFVVCDAGGGTVDLISYTVMTLDPVIELEEATPGQGSACGSIFLNRIFAEKLNKRFKGDHNWDENSDILDNAMEYFERVTKTRFNGNEGDDIPMAGMERRPGIRKHRLELSSNEIKEVFEPVISQILNLIRDQIEQTAKTVKLILLVGGFGSSRYLQNRVKEEFGRGIEVIVSPDSQTAVVRGALIKGLAEVKVLTTKLPRIRARKARKHYGMECQIPHDGHSPEPRRRNPFAGADYVQIMKWFLRKGDLVEESEPAVFRFSTDQLVSSGPPKKISIDIYCHMDPNNTGAPKYKTKGRELKPIFITHEADIPQDVERLGVVTADIEGIDRHILKKERGGDGLEYYVMDFDIEMRSSPNKLEFTPIYCYGVNGPMRFKPAVFVAE